MSDRRWTLLALASITAVGAALRFYGLEIQSLWNDELASWTGAKLPWLVVAKHGSSPDHPPGYVLLLHFWTYWFGNSEASLRMPSAIAGTLAIPATFVLGRKLYSETEGLIAAMLVALSWMPVYYSQEARAYALLLLFVSLTSSWLIDICRALLRRDGLPLGATAAYIVTAVAACYVHFFGVFFVALQGAIAGVLLLVRKGAWLRLGAVYVAILVGYAPALRRTSAALATLGPGWMLPPRPGDVVNLAAFMFNQYINLACLFALLGAMALAAYLWRTVDEPQQLREAGRSPTALLLLWVIAPVVIIYVRSVLVAPAFAQRSFIIIAPAVYLLAARAISGLPLRRSLMWAATSGFALYLVVDLIFVKHYFEWQTKGQFRQAAEYLVKRDDPTKGVFILSSAWNAGYFDYLDRLGSSRRVDRLAALHSDAAETIRLIDERAPDQIWFLVGHRIPEQSLMRALRQRFSMVEQKRFLGTEVWHFRYKANPATYR